MRYFKYQHTNNIINTALKEQYKSIIENDNLLIKKEKRWRKISSITFTVTIIACIVVGIWMVVLIPTPRFWGWEILVIIGKILLGFIVLIFSSIAAFFVHLPLYIQADSFRIPSMRKELLSKSCEPLREYYKLQEPYIIAKCFDATDKKFINHDVCIFVVEDELRLTTDIIHGFLYAERDLGCYAFKREEVTVSKQRNGDTLLVKLKAEEIDFILSYSAKRFIEKNFM